VREYLLHKWNHQCAYCDVRDVPLELDHRHPRSKHGSNRVSNKYNRITRGLDKTHWLDAACVGRRTKQGSYVGKARRACEWIV
jgi:5-methylcytosine-specific restriction endonuclease McrA